MKSKPLLQLQNVWKTYHMGTVTLDVLRGINVEIYPGEFVAIVGPSGSGKCVSGDTQLISEGGVSIEIKQINEKDKIFALDKKTGEVKLFPVSNVYKREVKNVLEIKTTSGKKITVTKEHPFFTVNAAGFSEIPAEQLKKGMFVATPRKINLLGNRQPLNSLAKLSEDHSLIISNSPPLVRKVFRELGVSRKDICNKLGFKLNTYDCWLSKNNIPLHYFVKILITSGKNINEYQKDIKLTALSSNLVVDVPLKTSPELLEFYGFLVGDGNLDLAGVRITNIDQELKDRIKYLAKKIFNIEAKMSGKERIDCNSRVLRSFFTLVFEVPLKNKSRTVKLPNFVFKCTKEELSSFIRGLFDCDSHVSKTKKEIVITLASESLIKQLVNLFLRYGIVARYSEKINCACNTKQKIKRRYYSLSISGHDNLNLYKKFIGFNSKRKINRLNQHLFSKSNTNIDVVPCGELIRNLRRASGVKLSRKNHALLWSYETLRIHPSRNRLKEIIHLFESNGINAKKIADLINLEVFWDKVVSIEEKDQKKEVYDVTVPEANNFVANNFIIHNSTMMNQVGILDTPTKGKIFLDGMDISTFDESQLAQVRGKKIGFVFQQFNLIPTLTALENVILPAIFQNHSEAVRLKRAQELLTLVGLSERMHHKPTELSGGQQQRVAIARALINNPEIILADEPTGNLDSASGKQIMEMLNDLHHKENKTIILVTHDLFLTAHAHKIIHLKDGIVERLEIKK